MTTQALQIGFIEQAHRIYLFDEVYPLSAAKEQAEKKKLAAFGMLSPMLAGAAMALSSVSVVSNALLLRRWKP